MMPAPHHSIGSNDGLIVIGWREPASLPDWGIDMIKTKIDTGARTSAIHVDNIEDLADGRVRFDVIISCATSDAPAHSVRVETHVVRTSAVRPSTGKRQRRRVVMTRVRIGAIEREIELSLVSRHRMLCRMLLGRSALANVFLVDPAIPSRLRERQSMTEGCKP